MSISEKVKINRDYSDVIKQDVKRNFCYEGIYKIPLWTSEGQRVLMKFKTNASFSEFTAELQLNLCVFYFF